MDGGAAEDGAPPQKKPRLDVLGAGECVGGSKTVPVLVEIKGVWAIKFHAQSVNDRYNEWRVQCLRDEIDILKHLNEFDVAHLGHERIIKMLDYSFGVPPTLTLELIEPFAFDVHQFFLKLYKTNTPVGTPLLAHFFKQLCDALEYMQSAKVVHGDIKCDNVLITRGADIKVIDFGCAAIQGTTKHWPGHGPNIAPEVAGQEVAADYPQDMFGLSQILQQFNSLPRKLPGQIMETYSRLRESVPELRMTLEQLRAEPWLGEATTPQPLLGEVMPGMSKVPLTSGLAMQVTSEMLKVLGDGLPCKIGKAKLMQEGVHVLYVDRRHSKANLEADDWIVRVPAFDTEISEGDWLYLGFPEGKSASTYFQKMAELAWRVEDDTPLCIPTYFFFDEQQIPDFADNYAVGPPLEAVPPQGRALLKKLYDDIQPPPTGYLHLRSNFGINLAGVRRGDELLFFPGADFVLRKGDIALFVRAVGLDGNHEATHPPDLLEKFTTESDFAQRAFKSGDVVQPLGSSSSNSSSSM